MVGCSRKDEMRHHSCVHEPKELLFPAIAVAKAEREEAAAARSHARDHAMQEAGRRGGRVGQTRGRYTVLSGVSGCSGGPLKWIWCRLQSEDNLIFCALVASPGGLGTGKVAWGSKRGFGGPVRGPGCQSTGLEARKCLWQHWASSFEQNFWWGKEVIIFLEGEDPFSWDLRWWKARAHRCVLWFGF